MAMLILNLCVSQRPQQLACIDGFLNGRYLFNGETHAKDVTSTPIGIYRGLNGTATSDP
jgi:hypothetical protein